MSVEGARDVVADPSYGQQILDGFESYKPKPLSRKLNNKEKNYVSFCEQYYHTHGGQFPTSEQAAYALKYSLIEIKYFLQNQQVIAALKRRGLDIEVLLSQHAATYLSPTQIAVALAVANFADTRPFDVKIESLGVTSTEYYAWLKSPVYRNFVGEIADQALDNIKPEAMAAFAQLIRDKDVRALRMYFEMTGAFDDQNETVQNLRLTLVKVAEAVARHVQDPALLAAISAEINLTSPVAGTSVVRVSGSPVAEIAEVDGSINEFDDTDKDLDIEGVRSL